MIDPNPEPTLKRCWECAAKDVKVERLTRENAALRRDYGLPMAKLEEREGEG